MLGNQLGPINTTNSTPNVAPDILSKISFDTDFASAKHFHAELVGLITQAKTTVIPTGATTFQSKSALGGGAGAAFNIDLLRNFRLLANGFYTDGGGRYMIGLGPSLVVRPNGSPSMVHSADGLVGLEYQPELKYSIWRILRCCLFPAELLLRYQCWRRGQDNWIRRPSIG